MHILFNEVDENNVHSGISVILKKQHLDIKYLSPLSPFTIFSDKIFANLHGGTFKN